MITNNDSEWSSILLTRVTIGTYLSIKKFSKIPNMKYLDLKIWL